MNSGFKEFKDLKISISKKRNDEPMLDRAYTLKLNTLLRASKIQ